MLGGHVELILASQSPRRRVLLGLLVDRFTVEPANVVEVAPRALSISEAVSVIARKKALEVSRRSPRAWVLAADTVVALGDELVGKARDEAVLRDQLERLQGRTHHVWTGLALAWDRKAVAARSVVSAVHMGRLPEDVLETYVASGQWRGKAGGYGIQDRLLAPYVRVQAGPWSNVVGLPLVATADLLDEAGLEHRAPPGEATLEQSNPF